VDLVRRIQVRALPNRKNAGGGVLEIEKGANMSRFLPLATIAAGALACVLAVGSAHAAPASGNILGKLTTASEAGTSIEKAGYRHHRKWWKKRYYKRHRHHHRHHRRWH
jgi:hypothetical protein